jgi:hypothetical protein
MENVLRNRVFVMGPDWLVPAWWKYAYVIIGPWGDKTSIGLTRVKPDENFNQIVAGFVKEYVENGKMPPEPIAPAIMNLADDFASGRDMNMRAGDYISIQKYLRKK